MDRVGNTDYWENRREVLTDSSAAELLESINDAIANHKTYGPPMVTWSRVNTEPMKNTTQSLWQFTDEKGGFWKGIVRVDPVSGEPNRFSLSVKIARTDSNMPSSME